MFKAVTLDAKRDFICQYDPAIDDDAMTAKDWAEVHDAWIHGGDWRDKIKIRPGEQPTVFSVGALTAEELNGIIDDTRGNPPRSEDRSWRAFLAGLRDVNGWPGPVPKTEGRVDRDWLRKTFVGSLRKVALAVGGAVLVYNNTTEDEIKNWSGRSKPKSDTAAQPAPSALPVSASAAGASAPGSK